MIVFLYSIYRLDLEQPSSSAAISKKLVDDPPVFNKIGYSSFGKASICSSFSAKSGSSTGNENLDSLLKTISKEPTNGQESLNDVNSIRVTVNKTSDLENNTDTLKKLSAADKPNNQTKLANIGGTPLPPGQIKCNILKGKLVSHSSRGKKFKRKNSLFAARAEEEAVVTPTKLTNQLYVRSAATSNNNAINGGDESLNAATFVSVVSVMALAKHAIVIRPIARKLIIHHAVIVS